MKSLVTALAVVLSILGPGAQQSAFADDAVMTVTGSGTINPGLSQVPTWQTLTFCGNGTVAAGSHAGTYEFCFNGSEPASTTQSASGSGTLSGDITGNVSYSRTGTVQTMTGNVSYDGVNGTIYRTILLTIQGYCDWMPTSILPTTSYDMRCIWWPTH